MEPELGFHLLSQVRSYPINRELSTAIAAAKIVIEACINEDESKIAELAQRIAEQSSFCWSEDPYIAIYQKLFVTQAAICVLYEEYERAGVFRVVVSPVSVHLHRLAAPDDENSDWTEMCEFQSTRPNLAFFSDDSNFYSATSESVQALMEKFWCQYERYMASEDAYQVLGLNPEASWKEIQSRYRALITSRHPDKGGDPEAFVRIRQAYESLHWKKR